MMERSFPLKRLTNTIDTDMESIHPLLCAGQIRSQVKWESNYFTAVKDFKKCNKRKNNLLW